MRTAISPAVKWQPKVSLPYRILSSKDGFGNGSLSVGGKYSTTFKDPSYYAKMKKKLKVKLKQKQLPTRKKVNVPPCLHGKNTDRGLFVCPKLRNLSSHPNYYNRGQHVL